jgi:hypothetical protein
MERVRRKGGWHGALSEPIGASWPYKRPFPEDRVNWKKDQALISKNRAGNEDEATLK